MINMSTVRKDYGLTLEQFSGTEKTHSITIEDPITGLAKDLSNVTDFATGNVKIIKPDGTNIATLAITYSDRLNGIIDFTVTDTVAINANAGNWIGNLELLNTIPKITEQQNFNFNILESN